MQSSLAVRSSILSWSFQAQTWDADIVPLDNCIISQATTLATALLTAIVFCCSHNCHSSGMPPSWIQSERPFLWAELLGSNARSRAKASCFWCSIPAPLFCTAFASCGSHKFYSQCMPPFRRHPERPFLWTELSVKDAKFMHAKDIMCKTQPPSGGYGRLKIASMWHTDIK